MLIDVNKIKFSEVAPFNRYTLYASKYDMLPNSVIYSLRTNNSVYNIDKILDYLKNFRIDSHFSSKFKIIDGEEHNAHHVFIDRLELLIVISEGQLDFYFGRSINPEPLINILIKDEYIIHKSEAKKIGIITNNNGLRINFLEINSKIFCEDNYNEDFIEKHKLILENLKKIKSGLYLFYGKPGTGKTSYISSLINLDTNKSIIYLNSSLITDIDNPLFLELLLQNKNSILIIEDAEKLIISRENNSYSPISALLNITDGILGNVLNIQIICTFNTALNKIDSALMRKGRLICSYEFKELEKERAINLAKKINMPFEHIKTATLLTDIYNYNEENTQQKKKKLKQDFKTKNYGK